MARFDTVFNIDGNTQTITLASGGTIRAKSKHYFYAVFQFSDGTQDVDPFLTLENMSAVFSPVPFERNRGGAYIVPLPQNAPYECEIPWEVLTRKGKVYVGIFAGDMLVTNEAEINVTHAAPVLGVDSQPTQSWWSRFSAAIAELTAAIRGKQDILTAGANITITDNVISATGGAAPQPSDEDPEPNGEASPGESDEYSRADHIHPITHDDTKQNKPYIVEFTQLVNGDIVTDHDPEDFLNAVYNPSAFAPFNADVELNTGRTLRLTRFCNDDWEWFYFSDVDVKPEQPSIAPQYGWCIRFQCDENGFHNIDLDYDGIATYALLDRKLDNDFGAEAAGKILGVAHDGSIVPQEDASVLYTAQTLTTAQKAQARFNIGAGTYSKPSGGIPASDLADGVIPSVPVQSVNGQTGTVVLDADDVSAIAAPSSPATGAFLVYDGTAWTAQTLSTWQGGNY
jgi:hypothetical protein